MKVIRFEKIDLHKHSQIVTKFRKDSFIVSFGNAASFGKEDEYLGWLKEKLATYPEGFVLAEEAGKYIGQLELSLKEYEGKKIGYVHLYYLVPDARGRRKGLELHQYVQTFFRKNNVDEFHLRVSPTNKQAVNFYRKIGMKEAGTEADGKVIRMIGEI